MLGACFMPLLMACTFAWHCQLVSLLGRHPRNAPKHISTLLKLASWLQTVRQRLRVCLCVTIFEPKWCFSEACWLSDHSLISQATFFADETCLRDQLFAWKNRKLLEDSRSIGTACSHITCFNISPANKCCVHVGLA